MGFGKEVDVWDEGTGVEVSGKGKGTIKVLCSRPLVYRDCKKLSYYLL